MAKKSEKTNALRLLDKLKIPYEAHSYPCEEFTGGEDVARQLGLDPDKPPLAVVRDRQGRAAYACCGYQVGMADLLRRVLEQVE